MHHINPKAFIKSFRPAPATFQKCSFVGPSYTVHYTVLNGTCSVIGFYELMSVSIAGLKHFLRYFQGNLRRFLWSY